MDQFSVEYIVTPMGRINYGSLMGTEGLEVNRTTDDLGPGIAKPPTDLIFIK